MFWYLISTLYHLPNFQTWIEIQVLQIAPEENKERVTAQNDRENEGRSEILRVKQDSQKAIYYRPCYLYNLSAS